MDDGSHFHHDHKISSTGSKNVGRSAPADALARAMEIVLAEGATGLLCNHQNQCTTAQDVKLRARVRVRGGIRVRVRIRVRLGHWNRGERGGRR